MKKTLITFFAFSLFQFGCSNKAEKPKITISAYNIQAITSKGVVDKILNETDYKKMHEIALAVESSRAVQCITVTDECNVLGEILNKIVNSTTESLPKESDNIAIYKLVAHLSEEYSKGENKLRDQWKDYINAHAAETEAK